MACVYDGRNDGTATIKTCNECWQSFRNFLMDPYTDDTGLGANEFYEFDIDVYASDGQ